MLQICYKKSDWKKASDSQFLELLHPLVAVSVLCRTVLFLRVKLSVAISYEWRRSSTPQRLEDKRVFMFSPPFQRARRGNQTSKGGSTGQLPGLPPLRVGLVHHLQQVSSAEGHACIWTWDGGVPPGTVVHHGPHVHLQEEEFWEK